jgi:hypothetical protein
LLSRLNFSSEFFFCIQTSLLEYFSPNQFPTYINQHLSKMGATKKSAVDEPSKKSTTPATGPSTPAPKTARKTLPWPPVNVVPDTPAKNTRSSKAIAKKPDPPPKASNWQKFQCKTVFLPFPLLRFWLRFV